MKVRATAVVLMTLLAACTSASSSSLTTFPTGSPTPSSPVPTIVPTRPIAGVGNPGSIVAGFGSIWVQSGMGSLVHIPSDGVGGGTIPDVLPRAAKAAPQPLAVGFGSVWSLDGNAVVRIDPTTDQPSARIPVPSPTSAITTGGGAVWVACCPGAPELLRIDPATNAAKVVGPATATSGGGLAYGFGSLWWINFSEAPSISRLDPATAHETAFITTPGYAAFVVAAPSCIWTIGRDGRVAQIDPSTDRVVGVGRKAPSAFGASTSDGIVWINDGGLLGFVASTGEVVVRRPSSGHQPKRTSAGVAQLGPYVWLADPARDRVVAIPVSVSGGS
ncbi:MAG TPA: hypothetical protein VK646_09090 [Actinomycetota bacterium]|nr:hypothetical protein [Actinomycetota bacterium]